MYVITLIAIIIDGEELLVLVAKNPEYRGFGYLSEMVGREMPIVKWNTKTADSCLGTSVEMYL